MTEVGPVSYECAQRPAAQCVIELSRRSLIRSRGSPSAMDNGELRPHDAWPDGITAAALSHGGRCQKAFVNDTLAFEGGILGRSDDMVIVRGVNLYPTAVEQIIREHTEIAEHRVELGKSGDGREDISSPPTGAPAPAALAVSLKVSSGAPSVFASLYRSPSRAHCHASR